MNIAVVGTGYVGLVTGTCFAEMGNQVYCVDIDEKKIENLKKGVIPIYEPGLEEMVKSNQKLGLLKFTTSLKEALDDSLFVFIAVGTPQDEDGSADLKYVLQVVNDVARQMESYKVIINKSTVPVGTGQLVKEEVQKILNDRKLDIDFDVVSNPEFLKEGDAIDDFMKPDRIVVGVENSRSEEYMRDLYSSFTKNGYPILLMDRPSAELTKYASNSMLATRISFMNEISHLCKKAGADINLVRQGIGLDKRIGMSFLYAGIGYGGSCFPKDVQALIKTSKEHGVTAEILQAVENVNKRQKLYLFDLAKKYFENKNDSLKGKTIAVWGLSFKPQTDDMREAPAIEILNALKKEGATIRAFDPVAINEARKILGDGQIDYIDELYEVMNGADFLMLLTEWHIFRKPDFQKIKSLLKMPLIFDGRNQYDPNKMKDKGFEYISIGR